jgi:hypothetical protein
MEPAEIKRYLENEREIMEDKISALVWEFEKLSGVYIQTIEFYHGELWMSPKVRDMEVCL